MVALDRPAPQALAGVRFAVVPGARPAVQGGQAGVERDVCDPPERQPAPGRAPAGVGAGGQRRVLVTAGRPGEAASTAGAAAADASRAPARRGRPARQRRMRRMRFMMTSRGAGPGGQRPARLIPLLAAAMVFTTRDRPQDSPQESAPLGGHVWWPRGAAGDPAVAAALTVTGFPQGQGQGAGGGLPLAGQRGGRWRR